MEGFLRPRFSLSESDFQRVLGGSQQPQAEGLLGGGDQPCPSGLLEIVPANAAVDGTVDSTNEEDSQFVMDVDQDELNGETNTVMDESVGIHINADTTGIGGSSSEPQQQPSGGINLTHMNRLGVATSAGTSQVAEERVGEQQGLLGTMPPTAGIRGGSGSAQSESLDDGEGEDDGEQKFRIPTLFTEDMDEELQELARGSGSGSGLVAITSTPAALPRSSGFRAHHHGSTINRSSQHGLPGFSIPVGIFTPEMAQTSAGAAGVLSGVNQEAPIAGSSRMGSIVDPTDVVVESIKNSQGAVVTVPGRLLNRTTRRLDQINVRLERHNYDHQRSSQTPSPVDDLEVDPDFEGPVNPEDLRIGIRAASRRNPNSTTEGPDEDDKLLTEKKRQAIEHEALLCKFRNIGFSTPEELLEALQDVTSDTNPAVQERAKTVIKEKLQGIQADAFIPEVTLASVKRFSAILGEKLKPSVDVYNLIVDADDEYYTGPGGAWKNWPARKLVGATTKNFPEFVTPCADVGHKGRVPSLVDNPGKTTSDLQVTVYMGTTPVEVVHIEKGFVINTDIDKRITQLLEVIVPNPKETSKKTRGELGELLFLSLWPGPTADVNVISDPNGSTGVACKFNKARFNVMKAYLEVKWNAIARRHNSNGSLVFFRGKTRKTGPGIDMFQDILRHLRYCKSNIRENIAAELGVHTWYMSCFVGRNGLRDNGDPINAKVVVNIQGNRGLKRKRSAQQQGQEHDESQPGSPPLQDRAGASGQDGDGNDGTPSADGGGIGQASATPRIREPSTSGRGRGRGRGRGSRGGRQLTPDIATAMEQQRQMYEARLADQEQRLMNLINSQQHPS